MGSHVMLGNGQGWAHAGTKVEHAPTGHAPTCQDVPLGRLGTFRFKVGTSHDAHDRAEKRAINRALLDDGWVEHTHANLRVHRATGATIEIERKLWVDMDTLPSGWVDGDATKYKVLARFTRTS